jgi:large subunit ribosomal protein L3
MHTDPGRVHKGKKMPGHMGAANRKARNLQVVQIEESENLLLVKGSVPGPNGGYLYIEESLKR